MGNILDSWDFLVVNDDSFNWDSVDGFDGLIFNIGLLIWDVLNSGFSSNGGLLDNWLSDDWLLDNLDWLLDDGLLVNWLDWDGGSHE
jgi:hypothetical protein